MKEIQLMMHGFGDVSEPLVASAQLIESILLQQMALLWRSVCSVAQLQESGKPAIEHFAFLLRKDPVRIRRFLKYLEHRKLGVSYKSFVNEDPWPKRAQSESLKKCTDFLQLIDPLFDPEEEERDDPYLQRKIRADLLARNMDVTKYMEFSKARQSSFGHGKFFASYNAKFREWLGRIDCQTGLTNETCDALAYFAFETVGEIMDLAFLVREDSLRKESWESEFGTTLLTVGRSPSNKQMEHRSAISPNEIREAMRRFDSTQTLPGFLFVRKISTERINLLCC